MRLEKIIPKGFRITQDLHPTTLREFSGGWNILDDDMNLSHKYARIAYNVFADNDGTVAVRQGYRPVCEVCASTVTAAYAVEAYYYNSALIVVFCNGEICKLMGNGAVSVIWDTVIAGSVCRMLLQAGVPLTSHHSQSSTIT